MTTPEREKWRIKMAKQMSVFNSAKKGVFNNDLPARPWAQQAENESRLEINEDEKIMFTSTAATSFNAKAFFWLPTTAAVEYARCFALNTWCKRMFLQN